MSIHLMVVVSPSTTCPPRPDAERAFGPLARPSDPCASHWPADRRGRPGCTAFGFAAMPRALGLFASSSPFGTQRSKSPTWHPSTWQSLAKTVTSSFTTLSLAMLENVRGVIFVCSARSANLECRFDHRVLSRGRIMQDAESSLKADV
jgi:hypothetical protein